MSHIYMHYFLRHSSLRILPAIQGKYEEAEPLYERSLAIREKALGPDHPAVATALNNRALLLEEQVRAIRVFHGWLSVPGGPLPHNTSPLAMQGKCPEEQTLNK